MTENVDVENADKVPDHLIDGYANEGQVRAGRTTADHPGNNNPRNAMLVDRVRNGQAERPRQEKNPPQKEGEDEGPRQEANPPSKPASQKPGGLSWWKRNMPRWLGGATDAEKAADRALRIATASNEAIVDASKVVMPGVTAGDLKRLGFSDKNIQNMVTAIAKKAEIEAQKKGCTVDDLASYLAKNGQTITLDAGELGITNQQAQILQGMMNKQNRA
ncbi:MAG: hypothetical protein IJY92_05965 [Alphaproteobacteria bacterium]|nr:hypothetical protein [Alphaproteobacteria bacterium]